MRDSAAIVVLGWTLVTVSPAAAADSPPSKAELRAAKKHFRVAKVHYRQGNFALALESFMKALKHARRPSIILNIAQCYRQLGNASLAVRYYRLYLSEWKAVHPATAPRFEAEVRRHIALLSQQQHERVATRPAREQNAAASSAASSGEVRLDQAVVPAQLDNEKPVGQGSSEQGTLFVFASPERAVVWADERRVGRVRGGELELGLSPGRHALRVEAPGHVPWRGSVTIDPGGEHRISVELPTAPSGPSLGWLLGAITTSGLAVGAETVALIYTVKANREFKQSTKFRRFKDVVIAGHIVAASFAAGTAVCWWLYYRSIPVLERAQARIAFLPLARGAYAGASVSF